jgi:hypothetical protein
MTFEDAQGLLDCMLPRFKEYKSNTDADDELAKSDKDALLNIVIDFKNESGQYDYKSALDKIKEILDSKFRVSPSSKIVKANGEVIYPNPPAVPFLVKQVIFFIAVYCIKEESINFTQADICEYLKLGHNFFGKLGRTPKEYVDMQNHKQPDRIITYNGHKDEELGIAIKNLVYQAGKHDYFVDLFGGTGAASTSVNHRNNVKYVYNDKDKLMHNLFKVISDNALYIELIEAIKLLQNDLSGGDEWLTEVDFDVEVDRFYRSRNKYNKDEKVIKDENPKEMEYDYEDIVEYMQNNYDWIVSQNKDRVFTLRDKTTITVAELLAKVFFNPVKNSEDAVMSFFQNYKIIEDVAIYELHGKTKDANGNDIGDSAFNKEKKFLQYRFYKYFAYFNNLVVPYNKVTIQKDRVLYAVAMIFRYFSVVRGKPDILSILRMLNDGYSRGAKISNPQGFLEKDFKSLITVMHDSIKGTICENEDYLKVINRYKSDGIQGAESPLFYSDSPYIATTGYSESFTGDDIINLINALVDSGDKFIFSCRAVYGSETGAKTTKNVIAKNDEINYYVWNTFISHYKREDDFYILVIDKAKKAKNLEELMKKNLIIEIMITNFEIISFSNDKYKDVSYTVYKFKEFIKAIMKYSNYGYDGKIYTTDERKRNFEENNLTW